MKYTAKRIKEVVWPEIEKRTSGSLSGAVREEVRGLYEAFLEREAIILELEEVGRTLAAANKKHFESARANYEALEVAQKQLDAAKLELNGARDSADTYRDVAISGDHHKVMGRCMPSEETRGKLMTICQDQGELTTGQRVDQVVEAFESLKIEIARQRRDEDDLRAQLRSLKDRAQVLETEAGNYRVKIGNMETDSPSLKLHEDLVPNWVKTKIKDTRWEIIAYPFKSHRTTIGLRYHLVHCIATSEFNDARDEAWESVIGAAFYWADQGRPTRGGVTQDEVQALETLTIKVYEEQQGLVKEALNLVKEAFEKGRLAGTERCASYLDGLAGAGISEGVPASKALTLAARDLQHGEHEKYAVEQSVPTLSVSFKVVAGHESSPEHLLTVQGVTSLTQVFPTDWDSDLRRLWVAEVRNGDADFVLKVLRAHPGVESAEIAPPRKPLSKP